MANKCNSYRESEAGQRNELPDQFHHNLQFVANWQRCVFLSVLLVSSFSWPPRSISWPLSKFKIRDSSFIITIRRVTSTYRVVADGLILSTEDEETPCQIMIILIMKMIQEWKIDIKLEEEGICVSVINSRVFW